MAKIKGKGGTNWWQGEQNESEKSELVFKMNGQESAEVLSTLGNGIGKPSALMEPSSLYHIRGNRKKVWTGIPASFRWD